MSLQDLSALVKSDIETLDRDINRGLQYVAQDFEKAFSSGTLEDLRKRQIKREYLQPLHEWRVYYQDGINTSEDIIAWIKKSREGIYRELTQGRLKGRSNCPWHNLHHEYRMEVYAALLPTLSHYAKVYSNG